MTTSKSKTSLLISLLATLLLLIGFIPLPSTVHADTLSYSATENWDAANCYATVNGSQNQELGIAQGDDLTLNVTNTSATMTLNVNFNYDGTPNNISLPPGQGWSGTLQNLSGYMRVYADPSSSSCSGDDASMLVIGAGTASLACTIVKSGSVSNWNVTGNFTNTISTATLFNGSQSEGNYEGVSGSINQTFPASTTASTFSYYNGSSTADRLLAQATCPAIAVAPAATSSTTPTKTTTSSTPSTTTTTATPSALSTAPTTISTKPIAHTLTTTTVPAKKVTSSSVAGAVMLVVIFALILLLSIVSLWVVLTKAGRSGWIAIIPIYSTWVLLEMGGKKGWWSILQVVPLLNIVALIVLLLANIEIAKRFGKTTLFGILGLFLFSFIGWPILAFGKATYHHPAGPQLPVA